MHWNFFPPGIFLNKYTIQVQDNSLVYLDVLHAFSANISSSHQIQLFPQCQHILDGICRWQLKKTQPPIAIYDMIRQVKFNFSIAHESVIQSL